MNGFLDENAAWLRADVGWMRRLELVGELVAIVDDDGATSSSSTAARSARSGSHSR